MTNTIDTSILISAHLPNSNQPVSRSIVIIVQYQQPIIQIDTIQSISNSEIGVDQITISLNRPLLSIRSETDKLLGIYPLTEE